jgi:hypothetical protein
MSGDDFTIRRGFAMLLLIGLVVAVCSMVLDGSDPYEAALERMRREQVGQMTRRHRPCPAFTPSA